MRIATPLTERAGKNDKLWRSQKAMILPGTLLPTLWSARVSLREGRTLARATVVDLSSVTSLLRPGWIKLVWKYIWQHLLIAWTGILETFTSCRQLIVPYCIFYKTRSCLELWVGALAVPGLDTQESTQRLFYSSTNQHWFLNKLLQRSGRHPLVLFSSSTVLHKFV